MANTLVGLSNEIKDSIYEHLEDLDDAWHLSQTCKVFQAQLRIIQKKVIICSHVYELDFHLSKITKLNATSAQLYHDLGKVLPDEYRPKAKECITCMTTEVDMKALDDADIREIVIRWRRFVFLRNLYMDEKLFKEYEEFRSVSFSPDLSDSEEINPMTPRRARGGIKTTHIKQYHLFIPDFKSRFHKCVVLHSIAIEFIHFASRAIDVPNRSTDFESDARKLESVVVALWIKHEIDFSGEYSGQMTELPLVAKIDCLEVFDVLYMFLLPKILPLEGIALWLEKDTGEYPFIAWENFLDRSRSFLQPLDLVELIENRAWAGSYPADRTMYMQTRGMFEGRESMHDFRMVFVRQQMVTDLRNSPGFVLKKAKELCWWDRIRAGSGSSFLAESLSIYREDLEKLEKAEGSGGAVIRPWADPMFRE